MVHRKFGWYWSLYLIPISSIDDEINQKAFFEGQTNLNAWEIKQTEGNRASYLARYNPSLWMTLLWRVMNERVVFDKRWFLSKNNLWRNLSFSSRMNTIPFQDKAFFKVNYLYSHTKIICSKLLDQKLHSRNAVCFHLSDNSSFFKIRLFMTLDGGKDSLKEIFSNKIYEAVFDDEGEYQAFTNNTGEDKQDSPPLSQLR